MNNSNKLVGGKGAKRLTATTVYTGINREIILAESTCAVTSCTGEDKSGNAINFKTHVDFTWSDFVVGIPYSVPNGWKITAITLASGNAVAF